MYCYNIFAHRVRHNIIEDGPIFLFLITDIWAYINCFNAIGWASRKICSSSHKTFACVKLQKTYFTTSC